MCYFHLINMKLFPDNFYLRNHQYDKIVIIMNQNTAVKTKTRVHFSVLFLTFTLLFFCSSLFGQGSVTGKVLSDNGEQVEFLNVFLLSASDSSLIKMELTEPNGSYQFSKIDSGAYRIQVTGIGYEDAFTPSFILDKQETKKMNDIVIATNVTVLDAVEVVARRPLLEQRAGKLVVNVDQGITGQGGSVTDLLKKVPGLVVVNDRVSMAGRQGVTILIDGRPTRYMDIQSLLNEMPADNIARIEVISQPGAAFDAEGTGGVINIILKKNALLGTNGSITIGGGYGELAKYNAGVSLNHRTGPWNLSMSTGYNRRSWFERLYIERRLADRTYIQDSYDPGIPNSFYLRLSADYDINDNHRVGISTNGYRSTNNREGNNTTSVFDLTNTEIQSFDTKKIEDRFWRSYTTDAYYRWQIDTSGQELSVEGDFASYRRRVTSLLTTQGEDFLDRENYQPADTRIMAFKSDYKLPINKVLKLETGVKFSATDLDNEQDAKVLLNDSWTNDILLSNSFAYEEDIYAAYASMHFNKGPWEANVGLRYENSQATGYSATLDSTINLDISKVFPSVSINTPFVGPLGAAVSYSYRIERPSYFSLNPFQYFLDPLTFDKGNPFLVPELTHTGQFSLTYEKQPFFNLSYDYTRNVLTEVIEQDDESGVAFKTDVNLEKYIRYGGSLFFPLDFIAKPISGYGGVMVFYHDYQARYLELDYLQNQWTTNAFLQVNIALPRDWKVEVTGWLQGKGLDGIIRYETFYGLDAGVQKKFLDDRLRLQLSADGIVQKFFNGKVEYANLSYDIISEWEAPRFMARLTWSFGNQFLKKDETRKSASSDERRRAQAD
jgi:ferric enterobactin receptor